MTTNEIPTPAQQHVHKLSRMRENCTGFAHLDEERAALDYALAALEAVEGAIKADTIAYSRPPMRAVTGIAVDDDRLTPLIGTRVLIIPADAVEVKS